MKHLLSLCLSFPLPLLPFHLKAGTLLRPFQRLHLPVAVQVGTEVAVAGDLGAGMVCQQGADKDAERVALPRRAGVLGVAVVVQAALVGDADAVGVVAAGVGAGPLDRACREDGSVTADVEVIADAIKSTEAVGGFQCLPGKGPVLAGGCAVYYNQVNVSHGCVCVGVES